MPVGPLLAPRAISKFVIPLKVLSWIDGMFPKPRVDPVRQFVCIIIGVALTETNKLEFKRSGLDNAIIGLKIGQQ